MSRLKILLILCLLSVLIAGCNRQTEKRNKQLNKIGSTASNKKDYELAGDFVLKLKNEKTDTIIFYKRTCINCCDFYNIFWSAKGQRHLRKYYFDFDDNQSHSKEITLTTSKIFEVLDNSYNELKNTSIKENLHMNKDGTSTFIMIDHYCYTQMSIYTNNDSIITDRMKDHNFDKYTSFGFSPSEKKETNDSYLENINSKWNILLRTIENEVLSMPETANRELETLRIKKSAE